MSDEEKAKRNRQRRRLRSKAKAQAYRLLVAVDGEAPVAPVEVACSDGDVRVSLRIARAGDESGGSSEAVPGVQGSFFSPLEAAVVMALRGSQVPLSGKVLARRVSQDYNTQMKCLLKNLRDRKVLLLTSGEGYRLAVRGSESRA